MTSLLDVRALAAAALMLAAQHASAAETVSTTFNDWLLSVAVMIALAVIFSVMYRLSGAVSLPSRKGGQRRQMLSRPR